MHLTFVLNELHPTKLGLGAISNDLANEIAICPIIILMNKSFNLHPDLGTYSGLELGHFQDVFEQM